MFSLTLNKIRSATSFRVFTILANQDRKKILIFVCVSFMLSILDVIAIGLVGIVIKLLTSNGSMVNQENFVSQILSTLGISHKPINEQVILIGIVTSLLLIIKMFAALALLRRVNRFMSRISAEVSGDLVLKLLSTSLLQLQSRSMQESLWILTQGVTMIFIDVMAVLIAMLGDFMLITIMILLLYIVSPLMALVAFFIFGSLGIILYLILKRRALLNGRILADQQVKSNQEVYEVLESFRETYVRNRRYFYATQIKKSRMELANSLALKSYLPNVGKYAFETGVTLGVLIFAGIQFAVSDTGPAIVTLGLFLGASSRIAPSIIRLQQNALTIRGATGTSVKVLTLVDELRFINPIEPVADSIEIEHKGFEAKISLRDVSFRYPGSDRLALNTISLELEPNKLYAIVGPSGAGKSTLIDLILGILTPDGGEVEISSVSPKIAIQTWPGAIAYLPQNVTLISGSISENISVGYISDESHVDLVNSAIEISQLSDFVKGLPLGAGTNVGDRGTKLSGGQRQRLGIARALFTSPKLLFLDEATSALDGQTEELVSNAILDLKGLTVITIAHRLSTIRRADSVIYLNNGSVEAVGSFQEVRNSVKEFDHQIYLMSKQNDFE